MIFTEYTVGLSPLATFFPNMKYFATDSKEIEHGNSNVKQHTRYHGRNNKSAAYLRICCRKQTHIVISNKEHTGKRKQQHQSIHQYHQNDIRFRCARRRVSYE